MNAENKLLRESLKRMSDNVNILINKMNSESQKKHKLQPSPTKSSPDQHLKGKVILNVVDQEVQNSSKAIQNLLIEKARLQKRMQEL